MKRLDLYRVFLEVYNLISGNNIEEIDDIPMSAMFFLQDLEYNQLVRPLIHRDMMQRGITPGHAAKIYGVSKSFCYRIGCKIGLYPKKRSRSGTVNS